MSEPPTDSPPFPVALKLAGKRCLVLGQGRDAAARAQALLATGARVVVVHPSPGSEVQALQFGSGQLSIERRAFSAADLDGAWLVVQTERDAALAARLARECDERRLFFCAVDQPEYGSFAHAAVARANALFVAIGTNGKAPALARRLRELFQELFDAAGLAAYVERLGALREATPSAERVKVLGEAVRELKLEGQLVVPDSGPRAR